MRISYIIPTFAISILAIMGVAFMAQAEETTDPTLEDRVAALETLVDGLRADLAEATSTIAALDTKILTLEAGTGGDSDGDDDSDDDADEGDDDDSDVGGKSTWGKGTVAICHQGKTHRVSVRSALTYKDKFAARLGVCASFEDTDADDEEDEDDDLDDDADDDDADDDDTDDDADDADADDTQS